jgi:hypothetical protein
MAARRASGGLGKLGCKFAACEAWFLRATPRGGSSTAFVLGCAPEREKTSSPRIGTTLPPSVGSFDSQMT